jgi:death-on-curing protein
MIWVTAEDVVAIHSRIIQVSGGIDGLRDRAGLEAAIAAPLQSFGGEDLFPTDIEKIARIGFGLASNHAFIDGNKRIGAMVEYSARDCAPQPLKLSIHSGGIEHPCRCR